MKQNYPKIFPVRAAMMLLVLVLTMSVQTAKADGTINQGVYGYEGGPAFLPGSSGTISFTMYNADDGSRVRRFEFDVTLMDGLTLKTPLAECYTAGTLLDGHTIAITDKGNNTYHVACTGSNDLTGNSGDLLTLACNAADDIAQGTKTDGVKLSNVHFYKSDGSEITMNTYDSYVNVYQYRELADDGNGGKIFELPGYNETAKESRYYVLNIPEDLESFKLYFDHKYVKNYPPIVLLRAAAGNYMSITGTYTKSTKSNWNCVEVYDGANTTTRIAKTSKMGYINTPLDFSGTTTANEMLVAMRYNDDGCQHHMEATVEVIPLNTYEINIANGIEHGTLTSSRIRTKENSTVTLTATPDEGYVLKSISVSDANSAAVALNPSATNATFGDASYYATNTFTFTMPHTNATATAEFMPMSDFYLNMPETGTRNFTIPAGTTSFKVYDHSGKDGHYGGLDNGTLVLTAPEGYLMHVTGYVKLYGWSKMEDYLDIYDGSTTEATRLGLFWNSKSSDTNTQTPVDVTSSSNQVLLHFYTNASGYVSDHGGVYLTVTLVPVTYAVQFNGNGSTDGSMSNQDFTYNVAQDLTANGFARTTTVTYNYNGATGGNGDANATATATFSGWATSADGDVVYTNKQHVGNLSTVNNATFNLYAKWADGSVTLPTPVKTGYAFDGWYSDENLQSKAGDAAGAYTVNNDITLNAKWNAYTYSVVFNGNGSTGGSMENQVFTYGTAQNLNANAFERSFTVTYDYNGATGGNSDANATATATFNGWATSAEGDLVYNGGDNVNNLSTVNNATFNLYAKWTDASITLPTPTKTDFTFGGWYSDETLQTKVADAGASYKPTADVTLYAKWIKSLSNADITVTIPSQIFAGSALTPVVTVKDGETPLEAEKDYTITLPEGRINVGEYTVTVNGTGNYFGSKDGSFTITPKSVTVAADDKTKVFGAAEPELTATVEGTVGEDNVTYTLTRAEGEAVGEYAITADGEAEQGNYSVTYAGAKFTITAANGAVTAPTAITGLEYNGKAQNLIAAGSSTTGTIQYSLDGNTYAEAIPQGTDAKEYTVYYKVAADANHKDVAAATVKVTIARKGVTVTADDKTKEYGAADPELTATVAGLIGEDKIAYTLTRAEGEDAGEYAITTSGEAEQGNYSVTYTGAKFTITAADCAVTAPTAITGLEYNGKAQNLIAAGSSTTGTIQYSLDGKTYSETIPQGTDAKEYTVYYKVVADANHKDVAAATVKVTIARKGVTVTADDKTKEYGAADPELTATVAGLIGEDKITYTLSRAEGENAGEYAITASGEATQGNYSVTFVAGKLTITKPEPNTEVVNPDETVTVGGETFYEPKEETKEALKEHFDSDLALSAEATNSMTVNNNGEMEFKQGKNVDVAIANKQQGDVMTFEFTGKMFGDSSKLRRKGSASTRSAGDMELISGAEYEVLETGSIVITVAAQEAPVTFKGISTTASNATGIEAIDKEQQVADSWYDLNGRRLQSKPTQKGIYIRNGQKIVIK